MRIEHEIKDVKVVRYGSIADALSPLYGKGSYEKQRTDIVGSLMSGELHVVHPHIRALHERLSRVHEGEPTYRRTCALVTLEREWKVREFYDALADREYYPAGVSEGVSYLLLLKSHKAITGSVAHLGTRILDEQFREQRLLTKEDGNVELIPVYGETKLKPYYRVVVVKKEIKKALTPTFLGRKK